MFFFAYNDKSPIFHGILERVLQKIIKYEWHITIRLLTKMNDTTNINMKLNIKRQNKMNINSLFQYENRRIRVDYKDSYACLLRVF